MADNVLDRLELLEALMLPPTAVNACISASKSPESLNLLSVLSEILQNLGSQQSSQSNNQPTLTTSESKSAPIVERKSTAGNIFSKFIQNINGKSHNANNNNSNQSSHNTSSSSLGEEVSHQPPLEQESFTFFLGLQVKMMQNLILTCCDLVHDLILSPSDYYQNWGLRLQILTTLYSSDLKGIVVTVPLSQIRNGNYVTGLYANSEIFWECKKNPECQFPSLQEQLEFAFTLKSPLDMEEGDILVSRHSNLCQTHVIFHLIVRDFNANEPVTAASFELNSQGRLITGLKSIARLSYGYDIRYLTIPLLMLPDNLPFQSSSFSAINSSSSSAAASSTNATAPIVTLPSSFVAEHQNALLKRCDVILKSMRGYLLENMYLLKDPAIAEAQTARTIAYVLPRMYRSLFPSIRSSIASIYKVS